MKKNLLFCACALLCAASLNAKTIYLYTGGNNLWEQAGATFKESISDQAMTAVADLPVGYYQVEIEDTQTQVHFQRLNPDGGNVWNETNDLTIPDGQDYYTITGWGGGDGNWGVFDASSIEIPEEVYEMKHPWNGGEYTYKTLTDNGDGTYSIRDIYGGAGCNWRSTTISEKWIAEPTLEGNPQKGDSAVFTLTSTEGNGAITITKIDNGEGPVDPIDPDTPRDTVFFVNAAGWETVRCYAWGEGTNGVHSSTYPGDLMEKADYQLKDADVYYFTATAGSQGKCLFNCGGDACKTSDLNWTAGMYYYNGNWYTREDLESTEPLPTKITYGIGSSLNGWDASKNPMSVEDGVATCVINLTDGAEFQFGVVETIDGEATWLKYNEAAITRSNNSVVLAEIQGENTNATLTVDATGDYGFAFTIETSTLVVTFPSATSFVEARSESVATKVIRDGQLLIIREGVTYNAVGQIVK